MPVLLIVFVTLVFVYSLVSGRLARTVVTPPILFTAAGMVALAFVQEPSVRGGNPEVPFLRIAEVGLVLLLFTDASRTDLHLLRSIQNLPIRLLSTGLLLTIVLGALAGLGMFRHLSIWEAGILGAILAPTDAGLGQIIVSGPRVPVRVRQALNVEAGLNDGLCVPFLMFFMAGDSARLAPFVMEQLVYGALVGGGIGLVGGWLLGRARQREWMAESFQQLGVVVLPVFCVLASEAVGASMFIAAFVAGLLVQVGFGEAGRHSLEFAEEWGQLLNLSVFFLFGMLVARAWPQFEPRFVIYAVLSLTLVRMIPVAIALAGTRLSNATVLFMGWFGPRGLASIVLGLVYLEQEVHSPGEPTIRLAVMATVLVSIFAHGLSARPGIDRYASTLVALGPATPEAPSSPT